MDAWRRVDAQARSRGRRPVVFEAVGVPGMLDEAMRAAPYNTRIVVVGLCMQPDTIYPTVGVGKHLTLQFVLGWTAEEFAESLRALAEGRIDPTPLITAEIGIRQVPDAFAWLGNPEEHAKILVRPELDSA